ncbi:hypothetical protein FB45DRAFT_869239 [Roridomyces roridus]|uniref:Uncharacterized protein n=1 Tax=Roridomyces roridus TaxID=1738132 RepID=A0AAD7FLT8_9AGAR|nr:hypothetical protein FB45DRAFT_869239 [Roridomyces roridus]
MYPCACSHFSSLNKAEANAAKIYRRAAVGFISKPDVSLKDEVLALDCEVPDGKESWTEFCNRLTTTTAIEKNWANLGHSRPRKLASSLLHSGPFYRVYKHHRAIWALPANYLAHSAHDEGYRYGTHHVPRPCPTDIDLCRYGRPKGRVCILWLRRLCRNSEPAARWSNDSKEVILGNILAMKRFSNVGRGRNQASKSHRLLGSSLIFCSASEVDDDAKDGIKSGVRHVSGPILRTVSTCSAHSSVDGPPSEDRGKSQVVGALSPGGEARYDRRRKDRRRRQQRQESSTDKLGIVLPSAAAIPAGSGTRLETAGEGAVTGIWQQGANERRT